MGKVGIISSLENSHENYEIYFMPTKWMKNRNWTKPNAKGMWRNGAAGGRVSRLNILVALTGHPTVGIASSVSGSVTCGAFIQQQGTSEAFPELGGASSPSP